MEVFGDHFLQCEHESYRIWRHDSQVQLLAAGLSKAARHPIVEQRPTGELRQRSDIKALGSRRGTTLYDVTISLPFSAGRLANAPRAPNPLPVLNAAWASKVSRFRSFMLQVGPRCSLLPVLISTLGGWHPEAHRAILSFASRIASGAMVQFSRARSFLFQRHTALLVTNNGACLLSGCVGNA